MGQHPDQGGDGVVYDDQDSSHNNAGEQHELGEGDFLVGIDIPEEAVSGAVLEINDGLYPFGSVGSECRQQVRRLVTRATALLGVAWAGVRGSPPSRQTGRRFT